MQYHGFGQPFRRRRLVGILTAFISFFFLACTSVAAQQATPRSVSDITAILDQEKPDPAKIAALRTLATAEPAAGETGAALAEFYYRRAVAAGELGLLDQWIRDLRTAAELADRFSGPINDILRDLTQAEVVSGNLRDAVAAAQRRLDAAHSEKPPRQTGAMGIVVRTLISSGRVDEARRMLEKMQKIAANLPQRMPAERRLIVEGNVADAEARFYQLTGKVEQAEEAVRRAIQGADIQIANNVNDRLLTRALEQKRDGLTLFRARLLRRLGRETEAEVIAREVLLRSLATRGKYAPITARAVSTLQDAVYSQGRYPEAEALARASEDILATIGAPDNSVTLLNARLDVARALSAQAHWQDADAVIDRAERDIAGDPAIYGRTLGSMIEHVLIRYRNGRFDEGLAAATSLFEQRRNQYGDKHQQTAEARGFLAVGLFETGRLEEALAHFRGAIPILLSKTRAVDVESTNVSSRELRLRAIYDSYVALLGKIYESRREAEPGFDIAAEAFLIADAARTGSVQRAVAQTSARAAARDPALAELVRTEQDLLREIGALYGLLTVQLSAPSDQRDPETTETLREQIDALREQRASMREKIERGFPDYIRLVDPPPTKLQDARAVLHDDETLIVTFVGDDRTFVWAFGRDGVPSFTTVGLGRAQIGAAASQLRRALDANAESLADIPEFDVALAYRLYQALLAPSAASWQSRNQLVLVADGPLGQLPFSLLPTAPTILGADDAIPFDRYRKVAWLARTHAVIMMPTVTSLTALRALPAVTGQRPFIGFGDPAFGSVETASAAKAPGSGGLTTRGVKLRLRSVPRLRGIEVAELALLPRLPETADEIASMARTMDADPTRDVFVGMAASEAAVRAAPLADYRVVAFATHGLIPGDLAGLAEPALALATRAQSTTVPGAPVAADSDGLLTMGEIFGLRLNAEWVVLSACNTGTAAGAGAEAVSGLGRAFFYAGTRALLVSNWPVETSSARALTTDVFARQTAEPTLGRAEALRRARVALIDGPGYREANADVSLYSYAHPIFWAPFTLIGDGSGR